MEITELRAYKRLEEMFEKKGYSQGIRGCKQTLEDMAEDVKAHPSKFDKQFYKDYIATTAYALKNYLNVFEYMPCKFIDGEMVACAMFKSVNARYVDRRGDFGEWFYSVHRRKPRVLTCEMYILGARCFAKREDGKNKFLEITPKKYRTPEYYFALCLKNSTPVMEDVPKSVLTTKFLVDLLNDSPENIHCFSEAALEREIHMKGKGEVKCWQAAIICDGHQIRNIPLNDERVEFFLAIYDKDSSEYEYGFKEHYRRYRNKKNSILDTNAMNAVTDRQVKLPIHYEGRVPVEYSKKYDSEEYLLEVYKKIGIGVLQEVNFNYYSVVLPDNISIVEDDEFGYWIKNSNEEKLIHYHCATVYKSNVTL